MTIDDVPYYGTLRPEGQLCIDVNVVIVVSVYYSDLIIGQYIQWPVWQ